MIPVRNKIYDRIVERIHFTTFYSAATPFDYVLIESYKNNNVNAYYSSSRDDTRTFVVNI